SRVGVTNAVICAEWTGKVFGVKPSAYGQYRAFDVFHVTREIARLPITVICDVIDLVTPQRILALEVEFVRVRETTHLQKEFIGVRAAPVKRRVILGRDRGFGLWDKIVVKREIR